MPHQQPRLPRAISPALCAWVGGFLFYAWCVTLPLVGRAGAVTPHARANALTSAVLLSAALGFTLLALWLRPPGCARSRPLTCFALLQGLAGLLLVCGMFGV